MLLQKTRRSSKGYKCEKGKTVYTDMGIWRQGDEIHMTIPREGDFHTTVNNKPNSIRCHKNLYIRLKKLLEKNKCWE